MSQYNPGFGQYPSEPFVEQRTSVMAVLSLVFALICCPPGPALLGTFFGIAALIAISNSNDRLVGRGLAIAGIIISLVVSALWLGLGIGMGRAWGVYQSEVAVPLTSKFKALNNSDYTTFRTILTPEASARITDADIDAFRQGYESELGTIVETPDGLVDTIKLAMESADAFQAAQGRNDVFPFLLRFSKGTGVALLQMDPGANHGGTGPGDIKYANIIVSAPSGNKWVLWDPARLPGGAATPADQPADAPPPSDPTTPTTPTDAPPSPPAKPSDPG